jgi:hypothetical protein
VQPDAFFEVLCQTFAELGAPEPRAIRRTLVLRERSFVGHCYRCGDFYTLWTPGTADLHFYSSKGELLRTIPTAVDRRQAA